MKVRTPQCVRLFIDTAPQIEYNELKFLRREGTAVGFLSLSYILFFPVTALVYFLLPGRGRNGWLLAASWFFYLCAGPESFPFLLGAAGVTYAVGLALEQRRKKGLLALALALLIGVLFLFKYLNFGVSLLARGLGAAGLDWSPAVPPLLLPAGISFYLFAAMGYLIDVYRGKVRAQRSFVKYALFLSFFPALLSGPIGRADRLLPQFEETHPFQYDALREGLLRFLWGAFKKLVLADRLAAVVNTVFAAPEEFRDDPGDRRRLCFLHPDLLRLFRLLRYGGGLCQGDGLYPDGELSYALFLPVHCGVLEAVAHLSVHLVSGLPLHPSGAASPEG